MPRHTLVKKTKTKKKKSAVRQQFAAFQGVHTGAHLVFPTPALSPAMNKQPRVVFVARK
jgi:hypothetical protein